MTYERADISSYLTKKTNIEWKLLKADSDILSQAALNSFAFSLKRMHPASKLALKKCNQFHFSCVQ